MMKLYSYLALGDSYTIGEQVSINESFPYQVVYNLRKSGLSVTAPDIVATSGFTTGELNNAIEKATLLDRYDFVSLLIGVNNQYREKSLAEFAVEFEHLLKKAIQFAGGKTGSVFVLSIPDWGVTPYAAERNTLKISGEIDNFNQVCEFIALKYQTIFLEITSSQRKDGSNKDFLAPDKLHPSGKEYSKWALLLSEKILAMIV
jgi:lysophospholipase L1-like esterase